MASKKAWKLANSDKVKAYQKSYYMETREKRIAYQMAWKASNPELDAASKRAWKMANKEKILAGQRAWKTANKEKVASYYKAWREANRERINSRTRKPSAAGREKASERSRRRYANDFNYKISTTLRRRVHHAIKRQSAAKCVRTVELLGCSVAHLLGHLESQFTRAMTWENYGHKGWHIDHILPCASFNLLDPLQQRQCFHWTNLQPLWAFDNASKKDKLPPSHQPELPMIY